MHQDQDLIDFRKELHTYPELSGKEEQTSERIIQQLNKYKPSQIIKNVGGHGVMAIYDSGIPDKSLLFRADMDALPIQEVNEFDHRSIYDGVSHKCGHDGHSTILLGLAKRLHNHPLKKGKVILLFQPAEEIGEGANAVLSDPRFLALKPDLVFALHNVPGYPKGQIVCKKGSFNPAVISLAIKFRGKIAHAAQQENGINPDNAIAAIINQIYQLNNFDLKSADFLKCTTIFCSIGAKDYGISPGDGELHYTIRCWTKQKLQEVKEKILLLVAKVCQQHQLKFSVKWLYYFAAANNDSKAVDYIQLSTIKNGFDYYEKRVPFQWGEDFGLFTEKYAGAMFGLGAGENTPALHHIDYDFPDEIIPYGVDLFYEIVLQEFG